MNGESGMSVDTGAQGAGLCAWVRSHCWELAHMMNNLAVATVWLVGCRRASRCWTRPHAV